MSDISRLNAIAAANLLIEQQRNHPVAALRPAVALITALRDAAIEAEVLLTNPWTGHDRAAAALTALAEHLEHEAQHDTDTRRATRIDAALEARSRAQLHRTAHTQTTTPTR